MTDSWIASTADVAADAQLGARVRVWELAQIRERASVGNECVVGRGVYVDVGVQIGNRCKLQNFALIYAPARLGNGVFVGPAAVLTNDAYPRAVAHDGELKTVADWHANGVTVEDFASIGARAVVLGGLTIGQGALVGAGAVVTRDVRAWELVVGVPARRVAWVGRAGVPLRRDSRSLICPVTGERYREANGSLVGPL